jgi:hypothetical protein
MPAALIVMADLANCEDPPADEFHRVLEEATPDSPAFRYRPEPGTIVAALDWQAVLGTGADLIAYAGVLWAAYERFIKPRRERRKHPEEDALLVVFVRQLRGDSVQFAVGREYTDRETFIDAFVSRVTTLRSGDGPADEELAAEIGREESWERVEGGDDEQS